MAIDKTTATALRGQQLMSPGPKAPAAVLHVDGLLQFRCCGGATGDSEPDLDIRADSGGAQLAKWVCDLCGSEYMFGIIARTREESVASEVFEPVSVEELEKIGVDTDDYEPSADEVKMCAKCDTTCRTSDWCNGCKEFVCSTCREYNPVKAMRHYVSDHWTSPDEQDARDAAAVVGIGNGTEFEAEQ